MAVDGFETAAAAAQLTPTLAVIWRLMGAANT
jgi:hypothetical protein